VHRIMIHSILSDRCTKDELNFTAVCRLIYYFPILLVLLPLHMIDFFVDFDPIFNSISVKNVGRHDDYDDTVIS
jgi:hypothetical protein